MRGPTESAALQQRNMQVIRTLKLLLQNSRAPHKVHMLAVRALGLIAACHPSVEIVKAVAENWQLKPALMILWLFSPLYCVWIMSRFGKGGKRVCTSSPDSFSTGMLEFVT